MKILIIKSLLLMTVVFGLISTVLAASPGSLDPSFGTAGFVKTNILGADFLRDIAASGDGKIVAVGGSGVNDFTIVRYTANGALDTTFSGDGINLVDLGGAAEIAQDVEVQSDGKIIVTGSTGPNNCGIIRLNSNGALDPTFDTDGKLILTNFICSDLAVQVDGKIVVAGSSGQDTAAIIKLIRLNANAALDTTFSTDGIVLTVTEGNDNGLREVKIQADGKIVASGDVNFADKSIVVRYNPDGSLDTTFSGDGIVLNDFSANQEPSSDMVINPVTGTITTLSAITPGEGGQLLIRYTSSGNLDPAFSGDGRLDIPASANGCFGTLKLQSDSKIVAAAGRGCSNPFTSNISIIRLNANGSFDTTFGVNGTVLINNNGGGIFKTVLVGDKLLVGNNSNNGTDFGLERYNLSNTPTAASDFDGDGNSDIAVFRPSTGEWFILRSSDNAVSIFQFGVSGDIPMDGDFDGDGRTDVAIFRPSDGQWWLNRSSAGIMVTNFGTSADKPSPGDYDKDGRTDIAVFRPATGEWLILRSSSNFSTFFGFAFGQNGDIPISSQRK
jgi:uncharacterized delta-60 repeat protein